MDDYGFNDLYDDEDRYYNDSEYGSSELGETPEKSEEEVVTPSFTGMDYGTAGETADVGADGGEEESEDEGDALYQDEPPETVGPVPDEDEETFAGYEALSRIGRAEGATQLTGVLGQLEAGARTPYEQFSNKILKLFHEEPKYRTYIREESIDSMMDLLQSIPNVTYMNDKVLVVASSLYLDNRRAITKKQVDDVNQSFNRYSDFNVMDVIRYYYIIKKYN